MASCHGNFIFNITTTATCQYTVNTHGESMENIYTKFYFLFHYFWWELITHSGTVVCVCLVLVRCVRSSNTRIRSGSYRLFIFCRIHTLSPIHTYLYFMCNVHAYSNLFVFERALIACTFTVIIVVVVVVMVVVCCLHRMYWFRWQSNSKLLTSSS